MNTKEAVAKRILELCEERHIAVNALAAVSGVPPSTIYSMLNKKSKNPLPDGAGRGFRQRLKAPIPHRTYPG